MDQNSFDLEIEVLLVLELVLFGIQHAIDGSKHATAKLEPLGEEAETELEEPEVVSSAVDGLSHIADEVLEEGTNDHIEDLDDLNIDPILQSCLRMKGLKLDAASHILLSSSDVEFRKGLSGILSRVDDYVEVMSDIVHEEGLKLALEPEHTLFGLHVNV